MNIKTEGIYNHKLLKLDQIKEKFKCEKEKKNVRKAFVTDNNQTKSQ